MRAVVFACLASLIPLVAVAQDWAVRTTDERLDAGALSAAVTGRTLTFYDDGQSRFSPDGAYAYTYSALNGGQSQIGQWQVSADGVICIAYDNGRSRCDMYVRADGRLVVLTEDGGRYPVRPEG
ncbi:hypothetical protein [Flavimaricola marinus]|uniref:Uncharacterized protein n=1 Tax=Flavimaricola marinus TaxID=1819565 RepID=A0A238LC63_9RHOB|nr:hypothetical protein [Flavimaricola marinus]SMY06510.1 hypothetical protein LOM8899_00635 [Flavimaricola marinus]